MRRLLFSALIVLVLTFLVAGLFSRWWKSRTVLPTFSPIPISQIEKNVQNEKQKQDILSKLKPLSPDEKTLSLVPPSTSKDFGLFRYTTTNLNISGTVVATFLSTPKETQHIWLLRKGVSEDLGVLVEGKTGMFADITILKTDLPADIVIAPQDHEGKMGSTLLMGMVNS